jgi:hypothetical protein
LPVTCIKADGTELECEHGDHPTYLLPVTVEFTGSREGLRNFEWHPETHALIYTDGRIAVTLHECLYQTWSLPGGEMRGADVCGEWRLSPASVAAIAEHIARRSDPSPG